MKIKILFFASCREKAGKSQAELDVKPGETLAGLLEEVKRDFPGIPMDQIMVAVNQAFARPDYVLRAGDEVALIPPVSGG